MKKLKIIPIFLAAALFVSLLPASVSALDAPELNSESAIVINASTGEAYVEKNIDERVYPASLTKLMTVLLAVEAVESESVSLYDSVTATAAMSTDVTGDASTAGIAVGETMSLEDLLYCVMLSSANEACNIVAEHIGGSVEGFVFMMNDRAQQLGCTQTHFTNTHGLTDENHYTTAADFALIAQECARHELFMNICSAVSYTIPATNMHEARELDNTNALLSSSTTSGGKYLYEYASGMKMGYTSAAGYCLASAASKDGIDLIALTFGGTSYTDVAGTSQLGNYADTITLYNWVFDNYSYREILSTGETVTSVDVALGSGADSVPLRPAASIEVLLPNDSGVDEFERSVIIYNEVDGTQLSAPIAAGDILGEISVSRDNISYGTVRLVAANSVELSRLEFMRSEIGKTLKQTNVRIGIAAVVLLIGLYIFLVVRYRVQRRRHVAALKAAREASGKTPDAPAPERSQEPRKPQQTRRPAQPKRSRPAPKTAQEPSRSAPKPEPQTVPEDDRTRAERDYFEEFFRQK